jgi:hypothetical protein
LEKSVFRTRATPERRRRAERSSTPLLALLEAGLLLDEMDVSCEKGCKNGLRRMRGLDIEIFSGDVRKFQLIKS